MGNINKINVDLLKDNFLSYCRSRLSCQSFNGKLSFDLRYDITSVYKRYFCLYGRHLPGYIMLDKNGKVVFVTDYYWS